MLLASSRCAYHSFADWASMVYVVFLSPGKFCLGRVDRRRSVDAETTAKDSL